jgi:hypothetical protein
MSQLIGLEPEGPRYARRVVTGHDANGKSVFVSDGMPPNVRNKGTGVDFLEIWHTEGAPAPILAARAEPTDGPLNVPPPRAGSKIRLNDFYPGHVRKLPPRADGRHPMMHRTRSIDYGIVLDGEIFLILDDSETLLRAGDIVVQCGTDHAWENRGDQLCRMAFILIGGDFDPALRALLPEQLELRT